MTDDQAYKAAVRCLEPISAELSGSTYGLMIDRIMDAIWSGYKRGREDEHREQGKCQEEQHG